MKNLEEVGEGVLPDLRRLAGTHPDPDVRLRGMVVAAAIEQRLYGEARRFEGHVGWVYRVVLTPDGKQAISSGDFLRVWDAGTGKERVRYTGHTGNALTVVVTPDGKHALTSARDGTLRLWPLPR